MAERVCGTCTICCKLLRVPETDKPVGRWCPDCRVGQGCGVHPTRPQSCRNFECFWLMDEGFPEELRPDRCGVVIAFNDDSDSVVLHVDPDRPGAWMEEPAVDLLPALFKVYSRVFVVCGESRAMLEKPMELDDDDDDDDGDEDGREDGEG